MSVTIREAVVQDVPQLLDIYNDAVVNSVATFDLQPQTLPEREAWFRQFGDRYPIIVAETGGEVAGYCCLSPFRAKPAYAGTAELSIYLDKRFRGAGIGTTLMERIIGIARERKFHVIVAAITGGNETSVKLHRKFGFAEAGVWREVGYKFGAWQDVHLYQLILNERS
ncbi:GNAT family N-acetyltransferase [Paenibacillus flagellatus]|uniref:GNAT family N-acetyltransferase n=1 Tax=Paenibacillus flagellatus TaxID=2211139 RepID=A0A2V5K6G6_9BACL|nr:GNAT family N-acetyltransferase [Paenibacillus flagellatus]PYI54402.1 GNAT family N-acetyltransferase [Paenibacillus flagellatus]